MHIIRTAKNPIEGSNASKPVYFSSILIMIIAILMPYTGLGKLIGLVPIGAEIIMIMFAISLFYCIVASIAKKFYIKKYGEWI